MKQIWPRLTLRGVVAAVIGLAGVCALVALAFVLGSAPVQRWQILLLIVMLPLSEMALLHVRFGGDAVSFTWGEGAVLVGFCLVSPSWLVLLAGPCVTLVHLVKGRGVQKAIFNGAAFTLAAGMAALLVTSLARAPYRVFDLGQIAPLIAGVLVFSVTSASCTALAVSVSQRRPFLSVLRSNVPMLALVMVGNILCAGAVLFLAERSRATLLGLPPVMVLLLLAYRGYLRASQERDSWRQLEAASRELIHLDETPVARTALLRSRELLRAHDVSLELASTGTRQVRVYRLDDLDVLTCQEAPYGGTAAQATVEAVLPGPEGAVGVLRLHYTSGVSMSRREQQLLSTFSHAVASALLNVSLHEDVRAEASRHAHEAAHDPLTGLANRTLLRVRTEQAMASGGMSALLLIDLDHFKEINDTLGHAAGDVMLQEVARRLLAGAAGQGVVARLGGDEFAILLTDLASVDQASEAAEQVLLELVRPMEYQGLMLSVEGSMGVACYPQDAPDAEELFRRADVAMYQAKTDRGSWLRYDSLRDDSSIERLALVSELRKALDDGELVAHFQQQRDVETGRLVGAEALVRWQHPLRGLLQPVEFVRVAEQSGLVRPFTLCVLDHALRECASWPVVQGRSLTVAVNLGARSLLDRRLPEDVAEVLGRHGVAPARLVLEITETTATSELEVVEDVLGRLRRLGVQISVDDFGTGYSSLSFLQRTAVHELKVDRSFVSGMLDSDNDLALVRATIQLAHSLGARAVAEGVESPALLMALTSLGCDVAQGYHLGRPVPAREFASIIAASNLPSQRGEGERVLTVVPSA